MAATLLTSTSNPVTSKPAFANSTASGRPTYPRPMMPIFAWRFRILSFRSNVSPILPGDAGARRRREPLESGVHHHGDELFECDRRRPAEDARGLAGVADQMIDLRRTEERRIDPDVPLPVEAGMTERRLDQFTHRVGDAGRDHVVVGVLLLKHQPHRAHVVAGKAPVAARVEIAEGDVIGEPELDPRDAVGDLPRHEL